MEGIIMEGIKITFTQTIIIVMFALWLFLLGFVLAACSQEEYMEKRMQIKKKCGKCKKELQGFSQWHNKCVNCSVKEK